MADEAVLKAKKTAILVIHGIGEQNPYETLDNFARHVADYLRRACNSDLELIQKPPFGFCAEIWRSTDAFNWVAVLAEVIEVESVQVTCRIIAHDQTR